MRVESNRQLLRNHNSHCPCSIAEATEFSCQEFTGASARKTLGYHLKSEVAGVRRLTGGVLHNFGVVIVSQPRCQFRLNSFPVRDTESHRAGSPPGGKASVTDKLLAVEEHAGFGAAKEWSAGGAALAPQQSQPCNLIVEVVLDP